MYRNNNSTKTKELFLGIILCVFFPCAFLAACDSGSGDGAGTTPGVLTFDGGTISDKMYLLNSSINSITLPQAKGGNPPLEYSLTPLPDGLSFNSEARRLSGIPRYADSADMTYTVKDANDNAVTLEFAITVFKNTRPSFGSETIDDQQYEQAQITPLTLPRATGGNGDITYSLVPEPPATALPAGLSFDPGTRELSGTPAMAGSTDLIYTATDEDGDTAMLTFNVKILRIPVGKNICSRTERVRDTLLELINQQTDSTVTCSTVTDLQLEKITELNLNNDISPFNRQLGELQEGDFDDLVKLSRLELRSNHLGEDGVPENVFDGLTSLTVLDLTSNLFRSFPSDLFDGLSNLETLRLRNQNNIDTLPEDVFDGLTSLTTLDLGSAGFLSLPEEVFNGLTSLSRLDLDTNSLTVLPSGLFDGLTSLTTLSLEYNSLTTLPEEVFDGPTGLITLTLHNNDLTVLPSDVFGGLLSLRSLNLNNNELTTLPADVFNGLSSLTALRLDRNMISSLHADVFDGLTNLGQIYIRNNGLTTLPEEVFDDLTSLSALYFSQGNTAPRPAVCDDTNRETRLRCF